MKRTRYHIKDMDCASEEQLVRLRLQSIEGIERIEFDLGARRVDVFHQGPSRPIGEALGSLDLGVTELEHEAEVELPDEAAEPSTERKPLLWALAINATLFVVELTAGLLAGSMGLAADALDMLADALVYALGLAAVGGTAARKKKLAAGSGYLQFGLALAGLAEVTRRFMGREDPPEVWTMVVFSLLALVGNVATLRLLRRAKSDEAHMEASRIFTSNDIRANVLVIVAGLLVWATASRIPDLLVGVFIFLIVARGARKILKLARS